jgi:hypothetical protein
MKMLHCKISRQSCHKPINFLSQDCNLGAQWAYHSSYRRMGNAENQPCPGIRYAQGRDHHHEIPKVDPAQVSAVRWDQ